MSSFLGGAMTQKDYLLFQDNIRKEKANLDSRSLKISIARLIIKQTFLTTNRTCNIKILEQ